MDFTFRDTVALLVSFQLLSFITKTAAIRCYECDSVNHGEACHDPFDPETAKDYNITLRDCDDVDTKSMYKFDACHKFITVVHVMKEGNLEQVSKMTRRMCSVNDRKIKCEKKLGSQGKVIYCNCVDDECNGTGKTKGIVGLSVGMALGIAAIKPFL